MTVIDRDQQHNKPNFTGKHYTQTSPIMYIDGFGAGYEGVKSFATATTRVNDEIAQYWADQKNATDAYGNLLYPAGAMKAAYGTFLTALLVEYCHDIVADAASSKYNVTWSRTSPIIVSVGDDTLDTYITLECDHRMGMSVVGAASSMRAFNYAYSSALNPIEHWVMKSLFPNMNTSATITMGLGQLLLDGETLEIFQSNGYTVIRVLGNDTRFLVIDPETGIVRDIMISEYGWINGAYCYYNLQTEWATDLGTGLGGYGSAIMNIFTNGNGTIDFSGMADNIKEGLIGFLSSAMISLGIGELYADIQNDLTAMQNLYDNKDMVFSVLGTCLMNAISVRSDNAGDVMSPYTADITWVNEGKISTCSIHVNPKSIENAIKFELAYKSLVFGVFYGYSEAVAADALIAWAFGSATGIGLFAWDAIEGSYNQKFKDPWLQIKLNGETMYVQYNVT